MRTWVGWRTEIDRWRQGDGEGKGKAKVRLVGIVAGRLAWCCLEGLLILKTIASHMHETLIPSRDPAAGRRSSCMAWKRQSSGGEVNLLRR